MFKLPDHSEEDKRLDDLVNQIEASHMKALHDLEECQNQLRKSRMLNGGLICYIALTVGLFLALHLF